MQHGFALGCFLVGAFALELCAQPVDHWEAVAQDGTLWKYVVPQSQPVSFWTLGNYGEAGWSEGPAGFGYGDGDDATEIAPAHSIYLRHTFQVENLADFNSVMFAVDYDDGYVAYLNGTEIGRGNAGEPGEVLAWNAILDGWHEAVLYSGGTPDLVGVDASLLVQGENVLAVEVHNNSISSSDFTARPFLFLGAATPTLTFGTPPTWFQEPASNSHDVTFNVNMANEAVSPEGVFLAGGGNFGFPGDFPMNDDDGDGIWSITVQVPSGFTSHYTFTNGACQDWSCKENLVGQPCADPDNWNDRLLFNVTASAVVNTCFGQCTTDGTCAAIQGCTDAAAVNFNPSAAENDGSCVFLNESTLPLIQITTATPILDDPRIEANMKVTNLMGGINTLDDVPNEYDGQITIEIRGSSSQFFPKQSYALETQDSTGANNNVSLLGMPAENDWILHGPYSDKTLMRNALIYEMGDKINRYTTRRRYCELYINGDYRGVYMFMENIKRDDNRVDIAKLLPTDTAGNELTGGYIMKVDRIQGDFDGGWASPYPTLGNDEQFIQLHKPEADDLHPLQRTYIEDHFTAFEHALAGPNFADPQDGYRSFIDVGSFIDMYFANEVTKNVDAYRLSTYFYKEKDSDGGKIVMGPWWDYNLGFGNSDGCDSYLTSGFESNTGCFVLHPFWFERLREDPNYTGLTRCMWDDHRSDVWSDESIHGIIDSLAAVLAGPSIRDHARWPRLGQYVWPNVFIGDTYDEEVEFLRNWVMARLAWLDANIEGTCIAGCTDETACNFDAAALFDDGSCEPCVCPGDIDGDNAVGVADVLGVLAEFGCSFSCNVDLDDDGQVGVSDILQVLAHFGDVC